MYKINTYKNYVETKNAAVISTIANLLKRTYKHVEFS